MLGALTRVVSLSRSTDRRAAFEKQALAVGLAFDYLDAVDSRMLDPQALEEAHDGKAVSEHLGRGLSPAEIACSLSHRKLYVELASGKEAGMLILEDDVSLSPRLRLVLEFFEEQAARFQLEKWVFLLGGREGFEDRTLVLSKRSRLKLKGRLEFRKALISHNSLLRTCAYYVTRGAALSVLDAEQKVDNVPDPWEFRLKMKTLSAVWVLDHPVVFHPRDLSNSLLEPERSILEGRPSPHDSRPAFTRRLSRWKASMKTLVNKRIIYPWIALVR